MYKLMFIIYLFTSLILANEFSIYSELGKYNKSYVDERIIKGHNTGSISSSMYTIGGYYIGSLKETDMIWGAGIVQSKVGYSSTKLGERLVEQPEMVITNPYIFIGMSKKYWGFDIGVSYYFNVEKFKDRSYQDSSSSNDGGWDVNRFKSHTYANFKFRLLKEDKFHFEILLARDKFSPLDSLLRFNFVLPLKNVTLSTDISLFMPANMFTESDVILKSNERFTFGIDYRISNIDIGANIGILIKNAVGGGAGVSLLNRLSAGFNISMNF